MSLRRRDPGLRRLHRSSRRLVAACSHGIDVYFENVGGAVFDAVLRLLNAGARIPRCGLIAHDNDTDLPSGPDRLGLLTRTLLIKRIKMQGFIIFADDGDRDGECFAQMSTWVQAGTIRFREDGIDGREHAQQVFIGLLEGRNFGKLVIRVATH